MHCAGANFSVIKFSGYQCDVAPFLDTYTTTTGVDVVTAATALQLSAADILYLVSSAALWFGDQMEISLFNGNILRDTGIELCTDLHDPYPELGIWDRARGLHVPLQCHGNFIGLRSYKPDPDKVLRAMVNRDRNIIYLDPHDDYEPTIHNTDEPKEIAPISGFDVKDTLACCQCDQCGQVDTDYLILSDISTSLDPTTFAKSLISNINITDVGSTMITQRHSSVTPEHVADIIGCGIETAKQTIHVTAQHGVRSALHPLKRRYRTDLLSLRYGHLDVLMYSDTMHFKTKSLAQHKCAQIFTTDHFAVAYPVRAKRDVGIPRELLTDNVNAMTGYEADFNKQAHFLKIKMRSIKPHNKKQNKGERVIGELLRRWRDKRRKKNIPSRLWDYVLVWCAEIHSRTYNHKTHRTRLEHLTGDMPDISEWLDFDIYNQVWFWDSPGKEENTCLGQWLGVSHCIGSALCYWVIDEKGTVYSTTMVQHVTNQDLKSEDIRRQFELLDQRLNERLDDQNFVSPDALNMLYEEDLEPDYINNPQQYDPEATAGDVEEDTNVFNEYLGAELYFDVGPDGSLRKGTVKKCLKGEDSRLIRRGHHNPLLDTRRYEVEIDGIPHEYAANTIAENLYSQVDSEGRQQLIFWEIIDHWKNEEAIPIDQGTIKTRGGQLRPKITTKGWGLKVEWADGMSSWLPRCEVKNANPVEVAEYTVASKINGEPAFKWWVSKTLRKRQAIFAKVKSQYWRMTHKFVVKLPHSVEEAYKLDEKNNNNYWRAAIEKAMSRVWIAFEKWTGGNTREEAKQKLVGYQEVRCHMIFDVKMSGLVKKARLVAGGHTTDMPASITYLSVVSCDSVRIAFLIAALNELDIMSADIGNAYLNEPNKEKIWTIAGHEFGTDKGSVFIITRTLYGLKSAGAAWRTFFAQTLTQLDFKPTRGDSYV